MRRVAVTACQLAARPLLGRGASDEKVDHWLSQAAPVMGFHRLRHRSCRSVGGPLRPFSRLGQRDAGGPPDRQQLSALHQLSRRSRGSRSPALAGRRRPPGRASDGWGCLSACGARPALGPFFYLPSEAGCSFTRWIDGGGSADNSSAAPAASTRSAPGLSGWSTATRSSPRSTVRTSTSATSASTRPRR